MASTKRKMDESETRAAEYLRHLGFKDIEPEPDGNVPPDLLADGRVAVEVRRLNQNKETEAGFCGLEETAVPLHMTLRKLLISLGPPTSGQPSWFLTYRFRRPIQSRGRLVEELRARLSSFREDERIQTPTSFALDDCFEVRLIRAAKAHETFFVIGGYSDEDSGGWVLVETEKNLRIIIEEKTRKIAPFRHKYPEWWLVLIDHIGYGVDESDWQSFRDRLAVEHDWDKIILLNPLDPRISFEVPSAC